MSDATTTTASARDSHLFAPGAKRILALDGGGVRGIVALAFLKKIEQTLEAEAGKFVRLCDYFDLIGGTSTGAIIAVGLALGHNVDQIREFYLRLAPRVFRPPWLRVPGWKAIFDARALASELKAIIGDRTLDTPDLQTGIGVMLKRIDTASAWILTNNPRSAYWETPARPFLYRQPQLSSGADRSREHCGAALFRSAGNRNRRRRTARPVRRRRADAAQQSVAGAVPLGVRAALRLGVGSQPGKAHHRLDRRGNVPRPPRLRAR